MAPKSVAQLVETVKDPDDVLTLLQGLSGDATDAYEAFKKKLVSGALNDPAALASEVGEMFSILADVTQYAFRAHNDHFEWGAEVDAKLDEVDEALGDDGGSTLLPEDASRLKDTLTALAAALRAREALTEDAVVILEKRATDAIAFITEVTAEEVDEDEDEDDEGDE